MPLYEVDIHGYGRKLITRDGPCQGLLEWPKHQWKRITARPLGLAKAKALADAQPHHATVQVWMTAEKVYDNGKAPELPTGWHPAEAHMVVNG